MTGEESPSGLFLKARRCAGLSTGCLRALVPCQEGRFAYVAGSFLALHDPFGGRTGLIPLGEDTHRVSALAARPNLALAAVADCHQERASITVYDACTQLRRKCISYTYSDCGTECICSITISSDGKYIAALVAPTDSVAASLRPPTTRPMGKLLVWAWEKGKLVAAASIHSDNDVASASTAIDCQFAPKQAQNPNRAQEHVISVVGNATCRLFAFDDSTPAPTLKALQISLGKDRESEEFACQAWLHRGNAGWLAVGTAACHVLFVRDGFVRHTTRVAQGVTPEAGLISLAATQDGGLAALLDGHRVVLLAAGGDLDTSQAAKTGKLSTNSLPCCMHRVILLPSGPSKQPSMLCVAASPTFIGVASPCGVTFLDLKAPADAPIEAAMTCHTHPVSSMSARGSVHVAASVDSSGMLMLSNISSGNAEFITACDVVHGRVYCDLHPSGHVLALADGTGVRVETILADGLRPLFKLNIGSHAASVCTGSETESMEVDGCLCAFSHGGQWLAAAHKTRIEVVGTYSTCSPSPTPVLTLDGAPEGLDSRLVALCWSQDDSWLVCATSSTINVFEVPTGTLVGTFSLSNAGSDAEPFVGVAVYHAADAVFICTATPSGRVLLLTLPSHHGNDDPSLAVAEEAQVPRSGIGSEITAVAASHHGIFLGTSKGHILSLSHSNDKQGCTFGKSMRCSAKAVTSLAVLDTQGTTTTTTTTVFVGAADGSITTVLALNDLKDEAGVVAADALGSFALHPDDVATSNALIPRSLLKDMRVQVKQYASRLESAVQERTRTLQAESSAMQSALEASRSELHRQRSEMARLTHVWEEQRAGTQAEHAEKLASAEKAFETRLAIMSERFSREAEEKASAAVEQQRRAMQTAEDLQRRVDTLTTSHELALAETHKVVQAKLAEERAKREEAEATLAHERELMQKEREQFEIQVDAEVEKAKADAAAALEEARAVVQGLRGEAAVHRKRFEEQRIAADAAMERQTTAEKEVAGLQMQLKGLKETLEEAKREALQKEEDVARKDAALVETAHRRDELHRKVDALSASDEKLREEAASCETAMKSLQHQVESLQAEVKAAERARSRAEFAAAGWKRKERAARQEAGRGQAAVQAARRRIREIQHDIELTAGFIQDPPELKNAIVRLFHKHALLHDDASVAARKAIPVIDVLGSFTTGVALSNYCSSSSGKEVIGIRRFMSCDSVEDAQAHCDGETGLPANQQPETGGFASSTADKEELGHEVHAIESVQRGKENACDVGKPHRGLHRGAR